MDKIQEARILLSMVRHRGEGDLVGDRKRALFNEFAEIVPNGNDLELYLHQANEEGIITYEEVGEEGFSPIVIIDVSTKTHERLAALVLEIQNEVAALKARVSDLFGFDPNQLVADISTARRKLNEVRKSAETNELLKPVLEPIAKIQRHLESVSTVANEYDSIYKNIIRPVQLEGQSGVRATVKWAIISIILSTIVSVVISNWTAISKFFEQ